MDGSARWVVGTFLALGLGMGVFAGGAAAQVATDPACSADVPAALALVGPPPVAVTGKTYSVALVAGALPDAAVEANGSTLGVHDARGVGWSAHRDTLLSQQAFSVGFNGPFTVTGSYSERVASGGTCTRVLSLALPTLRRIYAVAGCRGRALEPSRLVLRCDSKRRLHLSGLHWTGWNGDRAIGHGAGGSRVVLSRPEECSTLQGFIYTRAKVRGRSIRIDCPIPRDIGG